MRKRLELVTRLEASRWLHFNQFMTLRLTYIFGFFSKLSTLTLRSKIVIGGNLRMNREQARTSEAHKPQKATMIQLQAMAYLQLKPYKQKKCHLKFPFCLSLKVMLSRHKKMTKTFLKMEILEKTSRM
jgi:hypothetical protein